MIYRHFGDFFLVYLGDNILEFDDSIGCHYEYLVEDITVVVCKPITHPFTGCRFQKFVQNATTVPVCREL